MPDDANPPLFVSLQEKLTALKKGPDAAYVRDVKWHYSSATAD
jgi:SH3-like domain-containing protein